MQSRSEGTVKEFATLLCVVFEDFKGRTSLDKVGKIQSTPFLRAIVQYGPTVKDVCAVMYSAARRCRVCDIPITEVLSIPRVSNSKPLHD